MKWATAGKTSSFPLKKYAAEHTIQALTWHRGD